MIEPAAVDLAAFVRDQLSYDAETGRLAWRHSRKGVTGGARAGFFKEDPGYRYVTVKGRLLLEHRVAWLLMTGSWPSGQVDHINGNRVDNRWNNLRDVSHAENQQNRQTVPTNNRRSGLLGAHFHKQTGRFTARIVVNGAPRNLGIFDTAEQAHDAYQRARADEGIPRCWQAYERAKAAFLATHPDAGPTDIEQALQRAAKEFSL